MGRKRPRNRLGQFASYRSTMEGGAEESKVCKQPIILDTDSEDRDAPTQEQQSAIQSSVKSPSPSGKGKNKGKASINPKFPVELYNDSEEVSADDVDYDYSSEDVESMMDDLDKVFGKAEKKMCSRADGDPEKTKKVINKVMEWLYLKVVDVKLAPKRKKARTSSKKK